MRPSGLLLFLLLILSFSISGQILNRSFELIAEPIEPNGTPLYWDYENYARVHTEYFPQIERDKEVTWSIPQADDDDFFVVMHTGSYNGQTDAAVSHAKIWQKIFLPAWTLIQGVYFFGTSDYRPFSDYGTVQLIPFVDPNNLSDPNNPCDPNDPNNVEVCPQLSEIEVVRCSVWDVGDFGSTEGWVPFSYTILPQEEGLYNIVLSVNDGTDSVFESFLAIDSLSICGPMSPPGDVTKDCSVNMDDLSFFSKEWLQICSIDPNSIPDPNDPNYISDPNDPGYIDPDNLSDPNCMCADLTQDNIVDSNDLYPLHENWLIDDL